MNESQSLDHIRRILGQILEDKGHDIPSIGTETQLLGAELKIDSLDLATLVSEMEDVAGRDPFSDGFIEFRTAGELARLYAG